MNKGIIKDSIEINSAIVNLSKTINQNFNHPPTDIITMNNAAKYFVEDLIDILDVDIRQQSLKFKNYNHSTHSGEVCITKDIEYPIFDRNIILADGMIISGSTHFYLCNYLEQSKPKSISIICIGIKPALVKHKLPDYYSLFEFNEEWIEGYGIGDGEYSSQKCLVDLKKYK